MSDTNSVRRDRPLMLFGSHRSGTTWMGSVFSKARDVAYWAEPRQVWVYGNWFRPDDVLTEADARPGIVRHIRRRFQRFAERRGKRVFCEKTPSNCLRIPFVRTVYPEGRYVLIVRDGRAVLRSTHEILERGGARWKRMWEKAWEATPAEWPAYLEKWPWLVSKLLGRTHPFWGTRPPGWRDWFHHDPPDIFFAKQWAATMRIAFEDFHQVPESQRRIIRYEDLMRATADAIRDLAEFGGVDDTAGVVDAFLKSRDDTRDDVWRSSYAPGELEKLRPIIEPTLHVLGYEW